MFGWVKKTLAFGAIAVALSACSAIITKHGYLPPQEELDQLVTGVDTRGSVEQLLGPAQSGGYFVEGDIYYIESTMRTFAYRAPKVVERNLLAISFNSDDTLENIVTYTLEDGRIVKIAKRETDLPVRGQTFIRQLLGNIGAIDPGDILQGLN